MIKKQFLVQEKQKYEIMANTFKSLDDVINLYCELHDRYPGIIAIVDGVRSPVSIKNPFDRTFNFNICHPFSPCGSHSIF